MRTGAWTAACLLLTALAKTAPALPADVFSLPNNRFDIPIKVDPARKSAIQLLELYVSTDQGRTWSQRGTATPESTAFSYTSDVDGEYWFSVIIVDRGGHREPPSPSRGPVGQKVLVDTLKPEVKLHTDRQGDSVGVNWEIHEEHPDLSSFVLEWRAESSQSWVPVQASPGVTGRASIRASEAIVVRASVKDLAGNQGADEGKAPAVAGVVTTMGPGTSPPAAPAALPGEEIRGAPNPLPAAPIATSSPTEHSTGNVYPGATAADPIRRVSTAAPSSKPPLPGGAEELVFPPPVGPEHKPDSIAVTPPPVVPPSPVTTGPPMTTVPPPPPAREVPGPSATLPLPYTAPTPAVAPAPAPASPARNDLQVINTRRVTMEYEVSKVGPSGVGSVDLYLTRDDGLTWNKVNAEHQATGADTTPGVMRRALAVDLGDDGIYGFYLVATSGAGLSKLGKDGPRSNTPPQMRVKLDTKLPEAELNRPKEDLTQKNALLMTWKASDDNLGPNPITIQWAEKPSGPWEFIGQAEMANSGSYSWKVPGNIPPKVYLRLTVRDTAGNIAIAESPEAISIDLSKPDVEIRGLLGIRPR